MQNNQENFLSDVNSRLYKESCWFQRLSLANSIVKILIKSTFWWLGVLWVFLGSSLVLPWSLTRGGLGRCKGREILIKVLFWGKVPEYNSGVIDKECISESRCCERRAQYGLGRRNMLKHAKRTSRILFVLCIALTPQSGESSGAILEVPFKALLHLPHA